MEVKGLLDGSPILFGYQHGIAPFAGNLDGLARCIRLINQGVECSAGFCGCNRVHAATVRFPVRMSSGPDLEVLLDTIIRIHRILRRR